MESVTIKNKDNSKLSIIETALFEFDEKKSTKTS